ncbi:uncharacterized protein LOC132698080 [Cylas formicarius]|uniref:uncharacterized protein LOC132698080 n=1 Tax=Cylas formicarius TaxID=197179 RepID=UPI0029583F15|nr:uncharacterized protein LOC132698080 [Cylas formicarius]
MDLFRASMPEQGSVHPQGREERLHGPEVIPARLSNQLHYENSGETCGPVPEGLGGAGSPFRASSACVPKRVGSALHHLTSRLEEGMGSGRLSGGGANRLED